MKLSLLVTTPGKQQGQALEIKTPQFLIGRDPQCQLRPASPLISKRHCAILQRDGKVYLRDFGSTNGTFVNDEKVEGERELRHDDLLKIGPIEFTVRLEKPAAASVSKPTPAPATKPGQATPKPATKPAATDPTPAPVVASVPASSAEDDIAAMLMEDDGGSGGVPEGSTVFDLKVPPEVVAAGAPGAVSAKEPPKPADTRSAAASILEKMMRRPRT
ncbi:MAG: FHA domain-containing protein [Gemmataceae bacterium]|nr:FHA domain-containing protein [Gemmataceae bacterium]